MVVGAGGNNAAVVTPFVAVVALSVLVVIALSVLVVVLLVLGNSFRGFR